MCWTWRGKRSPASGNTSIDRVLVHLPAYRVIKAAKHNMFFHTSPTLFQLQDMGFEEDIHYKWAIGFCGDETCPRLWKHKEWKARQTASWSISPRTA